MNRTALLLGLLLGGAVALQSASPRQPGGSGSTMFRVVPTYEQGWAAGSQAVWNIPPVILGPTNCLSGDTLSFTNGQELVWTDGSVFTNYCTFTNAFFNLTVTQQVQTVSLWNGRATGETLVLVTPLVPSAAFSITPLLGPPPLATVVSNLTVGVYTNAVWTFSNASSTNTLTTNAATFAWTFGASTNDFSTNTVSLLVAGYGSSLLTKTDYVVAASVVLPGALVFDGVSAYAFATNSPLWFPVSGPGITVECWVKILGSTASGYIPITAAESGTGWLFGFDSGIWPNFYMAGTASFGGGNSNTPIDDGNWHHIAGVWDGSVIRKYIDGTCYLTSGYTDTDWASTSPLFIGGNGSSHALNVAISEFRITTNAVYSADFTTNAVLTVLPDTVALWHFTEGAGTNAANSVPGVSLPFTLMNGVVWTNYP